MNYFKTNEIAIVGCGYWGTNVAKTLISLKIDNFFCYDVNSENLKTLHKRYKTIKISKNFDEILKNKSIKIIFICVPTSLHYYYAKKSLENNKHIFVEKPVSNKSSHISNLVKIAKTKKLKLMSGYIYIYNKYINYIKKKVIDENKLGKIQYFEFNRKNYGPIRNDVSALWDLAAHDISILKYFYDSKIKDIRFIRTDVNKNKIYDIFNLNFKIKKIPININVSWLYPEKIRQINIIGNKKILLFDELNVINPIKIYNIFKKYPSTKDLSIKYFNPQQKILIEKPYCPKFPKFSPLKDEIFHFLNCIKKNKDIITDGKFALNISKDLQKFN
tara:strand:+ start:771 stop:1763 length:993 start_codon:yes stop_codon:yes gene_type:complete